MAKVPDPKIVSRFDELISEASLLAEKKKNLFDSPVSEWTGAGNQWAARAQNLLRHLGEPATEYASSFRDKVSGGIILGFAAAVGILKAAQADYNAGLLAPPRITPSSASGRLADLYEELEEIPAWPWEEVEKWAAKAKTIIKHHFEVHAEDFRKVCIRRHSSPRSFSLREGDNAYNRRVLDGVTNARLAEDKRYAEEAKERILAFLEGLMDLCPQEPPKAKTSIQLVLGICEGFPEYARQVTSPYREKTPLLIENEYDVQHHFHALLRLYFEDVRDEEPVRKFAGAWARMDFLIPDEKIVVELKMVREHHAKLGEELVVDCAKYEQSSDCDTLIFYIYNPHGKLKNPAAIKKDIENTYKGRLKVHVIING